jgi:DNA-binding transcriptional ArsR family regulator
MEFEEDLYTEIFSALKHPIRRRILRFLEPNRRTYTELLNDLGVDTGLLNYHLDHLGSLIRKDEDGRYTLSDFGVAALGLTTRIEDPKKKDELNLLGYRFPRTPVILIVVAGLLISNLFLWNSLSDYEWWYGYRFDYGVHEFSQWYLKFAHKLDRSLVDDVLSREELEGVYDSLDGLLSAVSGVEPLDRNHHEMWVRTRESLGHVSELVDDLRTASHESGIVLDDGDRERLMRISAIVNDYYEILFPYDYSRGNPWTRANGTRMGVALEKLDELQVSVAEGWLVLSEVPVDWVSPEMQAERMLVEAVGRRYFEAWFTFIRVEYNLDSPSEWLSVVSYLYRISVGDYYGFERVRFYFDKMNQFIRSAKMPSRGNLMPFNVSQGEAIEIALAEVTREYYELDADIEWGVDDFYGFNESRYVWLVNFHHPEGPASGGGATGVLVDPYSGEILDVSRKEWAPS